MSTHTPGAALHLANSRLTIGRRAVTLAVGTLIWLVALAAPVSADPPGNNGTVKIDSQEFDTHPNNQPQVGCMFQVDFYGFDEGAGLSADVIFEAHPPTGSGVLLTDSVFIGEDSNAGGGSQAGLDAQRTYNLSTALQAYTPHPKQGFHVKLTVHADGSQGADTKHKVFWVTGCSSPNNPPPPPPPPPPPGGGTSGAVNPPPGGGSGGVTPPVRGDVLPSTGGPSISNPVLPNTAVSSTSPIQLVGLVLVVAAASLGAGRFATRAVAHVTD